MKKLLCLVLAAWLACAGCGSKSKESLYEEGVKQLKASNPASAVVYFKNALEKDSNYSDARYQLAKAYAELGKYEQAEKEFTKVLKQEPSRDECLLDLAKIYNATDKGTQGFALGEQYLAKHPGAVEGLEVLGISCAAQKKYGESLNYLNQALKAQPTRSSTKMELAAVLSATGQVDQARGYLNEVVQNEAKPLKALYMLAALEKTAGKTDQAVTLYTKILQLDPNQTQAQYKVGLILIEKGELAKAAARAEEMIKSHPKKGEGYRLKGLVSYFSRNYGEAITALQQSVKLAPTLDAYQYLGLSYYNKGELETALSQFRIILDRVPTSRAARLMVAQTLLTQKRTDDAIAEIKKALAVDDNDAGAHNLLASAYLAQGLFDDGMRELNRATQIDPKLVSAHLKKGALYLSKGRSAEGESELAAAVQVAPNVLNSRLLLASYYQRQGNSAKAVATLNAGLKGGKDDAPLLNALAALQFASGKKNEGVQSLEKAKRLDPAFVGSYQNLAGFYAASGDYPKAIAEFSAQLKQTPGNVRALFGLAALSELSGKDADALGFYQQAAQTKAPEAQLALASYLQKKGKPDQALEGIEQALKLDPRSLALWEAKGRLLLAQKEYRKALKAFDEVEALNEAQGIGLKIAAYLAMHEGPKAIEQAGRLVSRRPSSPDGYLVLASVYQRLKDLPMAIGEANKAIKADPQHVEARLALGGLYLEQKDMAKAQAVYQEALKLHPDSAPVQFALGSLCDLTGKKEEALRRYRSIVAQHENFAPALNNLAYLCADGYGNKEDALRYAISAFRLQPGNAGVMDTVGYALLRNGKTAEAVKVMERAAQLLPQDPSVQYHLGLAYHQAGDRGKAQQALQKSLSLGEGPDSKATRQLLAQLKK
ncbi:lipoprotein [Geomonas silvestris]|uniref:Lipoprotein n=1 Tax=Geomonas silvestris TaxID=2740184 RepID=A0A6V8MCT4_9BACT|nr:XrtA/PEP-CTERM system TPR-repeat protein PrsT [Geomonas silvestris]GFO57785.1 lipoprotein [Geomonas silvestris]